MEEAHLALGRVDVDVDVGRVDLERNVHPRVAALGEERGVDSVDGLLDGGAVDKPVVDEEDEAALLEVEVGVGCPHLEREQADLGLLGGDGHELARNREAKERLDVVGDGGVAHGVHVGRVLALLLARQRRAAVVQCIARHQLHHPLVLVGRVAHRLQAQRRVVKQVLDRDGRPAHTRTRRRLGTRAPVRTHHPAVLEHGPERTRRTLCLARHLQVAHVRDARKRLAAEAKRRNVREVLKLAQLARRKPLAQKWKVLCLLQQHPVVITTLHNPSCVCVHSQQTEIPLPLSVT